MAPGVAVPWKGETLVKYLRNPCETLEPLKHQSLL